MTIIGLVLWSSVTEHGRTLEIKCFSLIFWWWKTRQWIQLITWRKCISRNTWWDRRVGSLYQGISVCYFWRFPFSRHIDWFWVFAIIKTLWLIYLYINLCISELFLRVTLYPLIGNGVLFRGHELFERFLLHIANCFPEGLYLFALSFIFIGSTAFYWVPNVY